jgi:hypothetical protein
MSARACAHGFFFQSSMSFSCICLPVALVCTRQHGMARRVPSSAAALARTGVEKNVNRHNR